ncbi:hypothetical protein LZ32DRAFT_602586 [Colletotrichum eremochloae]|nr:hypothetical protein LZ32DRAFT_602586 [Colletotrichum eremochloae]
MLKKSAGSAYKIKHYIVASWHSLSFPQIALRRIPNSPWISDRPYPSAIVARLVPLANETRLAQLYITQDSPGACVTIQVPQPAPSPGSIERVFGANVRSVSKYQSNLIKLRQTSISVDGKRIKSKCRATPKLEKTENQQRFQIIYY